MKNKRILYAKGGLAIEEAERLFPIAGVPPKGGPDQFLLAMLSLLGTSELRLVSCGPETKCATICGKDVFEYGARPATGGRFLKGVALLKESARFMLDAIRWRPTHIVCGLEGPFSVFALAAAKISGAKYIFSAHNALDIDGVSRIYKVAHRFVLKRSDAVIVHGPFLFDQALKCGAHPSCIYEYNSGFDIKDELRLAPIEVTEGDPSTAYSTFVYGGRIEEDKGVFDLLDAFIKTSDRCSNVKLIYAGSGSCLERLRTAVAKCRVAEHISVLGTISQEEFYSLAKHAVAVVTPSQLRFPEGRCKTAMEAFILGVPVIAPNYGPFPYLINNLENGLLYHPDDSNALSDSMCRLVLDANLLNDCKRGAWKTGNELLESHENFLDSLAKVIL